MPARGESYDAGMTRLCVYTANFDRDVARLTKAGLEPMAPPAGQRREAAECGEWPQGTPPKELLSLRTLHSLPSTTVFLSGGRFAFRFQ